MSNFVFKILLLEDSIEEAFLFRLAIEGPGLVFELIEIRDGAEALAFFEGNADSDEYGVPDLAVIDLNLPKYDGWEVLGSMRQNRQFSNVPAIIMSSSNSPRDRARVEALGIERYIIKPSSLAGYGQVGRDLVHILSKIRAGAREFNAGSASA